MAVNPGLKSRFSQKLTFPDFQPSEACELFRMRLQKDYELELSNEAEAAVEGCMSQVGQSTMSGKEAM